MSIFFDPSILWLVIITLACVTAFVAIKITSFIAILTNHTKLGGAAAGMLIVSIISSLPELVVIITSSVNNQPYLAFSDVVGANMLTGLMIAISAMVFAKRAKLTYTTKANLICLWGALSMYFTIGIFVLLSGTGMFTFELGALKLGLPLLVVLIIYILVIVTTGEEEEQRKEDHYLSPASLKLASESSKESVEQPKYKINTYIYLTVIFSILLITLAVILSFAADKAATPEGYNLGHGVAGALILAVVTSIPEISSLFNLTKLGFRNIAIAGVVGSHIFNFVLLFVGDIFYTGKGKEGATGNFIADSYKGHEQEFLSILGLVSLISILLIVSFSKLGARTKLGDIARYTIMGVFAIGWVVIKVIL